MMVGLGYCVYIYSTIPKDVRKLLDKAICIHLNLWYTLAMSFFIWGVVGAILWVLGKLKLNIERAKKIGLPFVVVRKFCFPCLLRVELGDAARKVGELRILTFNDALADALKTCFTREILTKQQHCQILDSSGHSSTS